MTRYSKLAIAGSLAAVFIGCLALFGWMTDHAALAKALPGIDEMTFNTALCLLLLGISILAPRGMQSLRFGLAGLAGLLALLTLLQLLAGIDLGIDNLFVDHAAAYPRNIYPGRMSPATVAACLSSSIAALLIIRGLEKRRTCLMASALIGATGIVSLYGIAMTMTFQEKSASLAYPLSMSLFTAIAFLALAIALWGMFRRTCSSIVAHDIFYPAIRLMLKLSFPRKFLLIAFVFAIPLTISMQYTLSSLSLGIERALKDRSGIAFLGEASRLLVAVQRHRGVLNVRLHGDSSIGDISMQQDMQGIRKSIGSLQAWADENKTKQYELERLQEVESLWHRVEQHESGGDADQLWDMHTKIIQQLSRLMTQIGSELSYSLDANLSFHNVSDAALDHLPQVMETVGQARGLGAGYLAEKRVGKIGNYRLSNLNSQMELQMQRVKEHLERMDEAQPIAQPVKRQVDQLALAVASFEHVTRSTFLEREDFSVTPKYYFLQGTQLIETAAELQALLLEHLSEVLTGEIEKKFTGMYRIKSIAVFSLLLIIFLFLAFYRSIMHMIESLAETAERMKRGDMREMELMPEDELGHVAHSFNTVADELTRVSAHMQAIFKYAVDGIITIDRKGAILEINPAAEKMFGYQRGELVGRNITTLMPEKYRARHDAGLARYLSQGHSRILGRAIELEGLKKDASIFPMDLSVNEMQVSGEERRFIGMVRDIRSRKQRDAEIRRLAVVVEQAAEAIIITNADGVIEFVNPAFEALNGYSMDEAIGNTPRILKSGKQSSDFYEELWQTISKGGIWRAQLVNRRKDGTLYDAEHIISPIFDADGKITHFVGFQRDMTSEKALRTQMEHAQRLESLGVLAGGIAHDFNNILTAIMGNVALAERRLDAGSPAMDFLKRVEDSTQGAANLCKQMLAYSGKGKFEVKPLNLSDLVEEISRLMEVSIKKNVLLRYNLAKNLPAVEADAAQLQQVILNLITNANEAIEEKSGVITLNTGVMFADSAYLLNTYTNASLPEGRYVYLEVSDTGCGMDAKTIKRIFDPFFTTKFTGRGLGMSAVVGIINSHRGALKIYSEVGRGTTFKILLPMCDKKAFSAPVRSKQSSDWRGEGAVLVVDDEDTIREVAAMMLEDMGFRTLGATDGLHALELYEKHRHEIACVLLDMTMPKMDGEACFSELRRLNPEVVVVLSSGYTEQDATPRFIGKGLAGFIQKPYTPEALQEKLQEVLKAKIA